MAKDITFQIMLNAPNHILAGDKANRRYTNGDIISAYLTTTLATLNGQDYISNDVISSPRLAFVHVLNVPNDVAEKIQNILEPQKTGSIITKRKKYYVDLSLVQQSKLDEITQNKQTTVNWSAFKSVTKTKVDESFITDEELING
jgi:hypothetical protein